MRNDPLNPVDTHEDYRHCLRAVREKHADKTALVMYDAAGEAHETSYASFADDVDALAAALTSLGLAGKHIAIVAESGVRWLVALFAIAVTGGVVVAVDTEQSDRVLAEMTLHADASAAFCSGAFLPLFTELSDKHEALQTIIALEGRPEGATCLTYDELIADGRLRARMACGTEMPPMTDKPALIVYTSGTTSISKPVLLTHGNVMRNASGASAMIEMGKRIYTSLPLYHTYGLVCGVLAHFTQGKTVCINGNLKHMMRDLRLFEPDSLSAVPLIVEALYARIRAELRRGGRPERAERAILRRTLLQRMRIASRVPCREAVEAVVGRNLHMLVCGGAHLNRRVALIMEALGIRVMQGYGITECSPLVTVNRNRARRLHSAGLPLPDTEIDIRGGDIYVRGPSVAQGYYKDEKQTAKFFKDGWFATGDIGRIDRDGFLYINGRKKNLIVFKNGKKVSPEEIERMVDDIPLIREALAYGVSAGSSTDDVKLGLMVYPDPALTQGLSSFEILRRVQAEIDRVNRGMPSYKQIQIVKLKDAAFEKTSSQKLKRYGF